MSRTRPRSWWKQWAMTSLGAAAIVTALDAALLQQTRSYFTGGFLAADSLATAGQAGAFLAGSLLADFAILSLFTALVFRVAARLGASWHSATIAAVALSVAPLATADVVEYELISYLGDAFDLRLMFDLAGRDVSEVLAVSSAHVATFLIAISVSLLVLLAALVWVQRRLKQRDPVAREPPATRVVLAVSMTLLIAATVTTAMRSASDVLDNGIRRKPSGQWLGLAVNRLSDLDGDGYGVLGRPPDGDLLNADVRPYAIDRPGNGIDEDGVAGDLPTAEPRYQENATPVAPWRQRPDVVLVVLESFRADALGAHVDGRPVTPVLDELAARGVSSQAAYSHNGYTVQARHHIFSGSLAGLRGPSTLIDDFKANGYETAYFSGQDESFGGPAFGVGFDRADVAYDARHDRDRRYTRFSTAGSLAVPYTLVTERVSQFLERRGRTRPLFLYVNFHDTHFPYHHDAIKPLLTRTALEQSAIVPERRRELMATYLNTATNVDRAIGDVLDRARRTLAREPAVIVLGDHGESLFDEGFLGHGYALNDAQTRIPLIVANLPMVVPEPFGQADLRDAIRAALAAPDAAAPPRLVPDSERRVFQYLGNIERPAQIKLTGLDAQISYDFRSGRVRTDAGFWVPGDAQPAQSRVRWRALVAMWERMMIARADRHDGRP